MNPEAFFHVPQDVYELYKQSADKGAKANEEWDALFASYKSKYPTEAAELARRISGDLPEGWEKHLPVYKMGDAAVGSRKYSEVVLEALAAPLPELVGGSADLTGSNFTRWQKAVDFQAPQTGLGDYSGRYIRYGVREHAMGAIMNGLHAYGVIIPFGGTFLNFVRSFPFGLPLP
jgi:transketolase